MIEASGIDHIVLHVDNPFAVGTPITERPPHRSERAQFGHSAPTLVFDGARTLTRLDHLSRSIWQGLAARAVADDDAQALAERLHARRAVLRGEIKPVGFPVG